MPTLPLPGTDLYYEVQGAGPAVLLIHGLGLDLRMWDEQVAALRDEAELVRYDARGFGRSTRRDLGVAYTHARDAWSLLDELGVREAVVVGLSMGGRIAMQTVLEQPDRVRALVLLDAVLDGVAWDDASERGMAAIGEALRTGGLPAARAAWLAHPFFVPAGRHPALAARLARMVTEYPGLDWTETDPHLPQPPLIDALGRISAPTTVVCGELDVPCFREMSDVLTARIPGAVRVDVPDAGHMVNMEASDAVNIVLRDVIRSAA
jgi:3-oxoadipate enol-lactonase